MKKIHLLPNVLTALGLTCGLFVIFKLNVTDIGKADESVLMISTGILLLAAFFDLLDGAVARAIRATSEFGGFFDSLADAISFGVAPSVIVLKSLSVEPKTFESFLITTAALVFSVCGVLRLVRFSVNAAIEKGNAELEDASRKNFTGLPIPAAAAAIVSLNLLFESSDLKDLWLVSESWRVVILSFAMFVIGYFMISRWKFPSMKNLHIRVKNFQMVFFTVLFAVLIFFGLINHFAFVFAALAWSYLLLAWTLSIIRMIAGRKSKTLEDYEPDDDDIDAI